MGSFATSSPFGSGEITGSGTANTIAMFTSAGTIGNSVITQNAGASSIMFTPSVAATGAITNFIFNQSATTNQTASTDVPGLKFIGSSKQFATGAKSIQRETYFTTTTYTAVGATTITNAFGAYFEAPTASTNITITNNWGLGVSGNIATSGNLYIGSLTTAAPALLNIAPGTAGSSQINLAASTAPTITANGDFYYTAADGFNFYTRDVSNLNDLLTISNGTNSLAFFADTTTNFYLYTPSATTNLTIAVNGGATPNYQIGATGFHSWQSPATAAGTSTVAFRWTPGAKTNQTLSTALPTYVFTTGAIQFATGTIASQQAFQIAQPTYSFVGASTITNAYTLFVTAPAAGTNATITNNWGIGVTGNIAATGNLYLGSVTTATTAFLNFAASTTAKAQINFNTTGAAPTSPNTGDLYLDSALPGLTAYNTNASTYVFSVKNATQTGGLGLFGGGLGFYIASSTADNVTIATNSGGSATTWFTNGGVKVNPTVGVTPTAQFTVGTGGLTNLLEFKTTADTVNLWVISQKGNMVLTPGITATGAITSFSYTVPANTNQTLSTEIPSLKYNGGSRQWATGAIATQREQYQTTTTYTAVGASVITNAYGSYIEAPTASTNVTITNNYAMGLSGNLALVTVGNFIAIKEGSNGRMGQVALVSGTIDISIANVTTNSRAFITLVTPSGVTLTTGYRAVCTAGHLVITAIVAEGTINTADTSTLNYEIFEAIP